MFLKTLFQHSKPQISKESVIKRLILDELRTTLSAQFNNADGLDGKLKQLLSSASLILSIVTALQITTGIEQIGWFYLTVLVFALVLYAALVIVIVRGLRPMTYHSSIPTDWDEIADRYFGEDEDEALSTLISTYLDALDKNDIPINHKARMVTFASRLLVAIVLTLIILGIIGLSYSVVLPWESPLPTP